MEGVRAKNQVNKARVIDSYKCGWSKKEIDDFMV